MKNTKIGFLHPGEMGISVAVSAQNSGHTVIWASKGRSASTRVRAEKYNLIEVKNIKEMGENCSIIVSVCPPKAAIEVAKQVLKTTFTGIFVDANAISPQRTHEIHKLLTQAGVKYVDGGIIGSPAWEKNSTFLYLSGIEAEEVSTCFEAGPLVTEVISKEIGRASALKMCYAAKTKGTTALLCSIVAASEVLGVWKNLERQWSCETPEFVNKTLNDIRKVTTKSWRFSGEMEEIASTLEHAGLPSGFHMAAAEIYERMKSFKDLETTPEIKEIIKALIDKS